MRTALRSAEPAHKGVIKMSEEIEMPHRKKKESSTSKSSKKSKHKHIWEECFLHTILPYKYYSWISDTAEKEKILDTLAPGYRCVFCGRLKMNYDTSLRYAHEGRFLRALTKKDLLDLHPDWPIYDVPGEDWYKL